MFFQIINFCFVSCSDGSNMQLPHVLCKHCEKFYAFSVAGSVPCIELCTIFDNKHETDIIALDCHCSCIALGPLHERHESCRLVGPGLPEVIC